MKGLLTPSYAAKEKKTTTSQLSGESGKLFCQFLKKILEPEVRTGAGRSSEEKEKMKALKVRTT